MAFQHENQRTSRAFDQRETVRTRAPLREPHTYHRLPPRERPLIDSYRPPARDLSDRPDYVDAYGRTAWRPELSPRALDTRARQADLNDDRMDRRGSARTECWSPSYALPAQPIIVNPLDYGFPPGYGNLSDYIMVLVPRTPALRYDEDPHAAGRHAADALQRVHDYHAHQRAVNPPVTDPEALQRVADAEGMQAAKSLSMGAAYRRMMDESLPTRVSPQRALEDTAATAAVSPRNGSPLRQNENQYSRAPLAPTPAPLLQPTVPTAVLADDDVVEVKKEPKVLEVITIEDDPIADVKTEPVEDEIMAESDPVEPTHNEVLPTDNAATRYTPYIPHPHLSFISKKRRRIDDHDLPIKRQSLEPNALLELRAATEELEISGGIDRASHAQASKQDVPADWHGGQDVSVKSEQREESEEYVPADDILSSEEQQSAELRAQLEQYALSSDVADSPEPDMSAPQEQPNQIADSHDTAAPAQDEEPAQLQRPDIPQDTATAAKAEQPEQLEPRGLSVHGTLVLQKQPPRRRANKLPASAPDTRYVDLSNIGISHMSVFLTDEHFRGSAAKAKFRQMLFKTVAWHEGADMYLGLAIWDCLLSYWFIKYDDKGEVHTQPVRLKGAVMMPRQLIECHKKLEEKHGYPMEEILDENDVHQAYAEALAEHDRPRPEDIRLTPDWVQEAYSILDDQRDRAAGKLTKRVASARERERYSRAHRPSGKLWHHDLKVLKKKPTTPEIAPPVLIPNPVTVAADTWTRGDGRGTRYPPKIIWSVKGSTVRKVVVPGSAF